MRGGNWLVLGAAFLMVSAMGAAVSFPVHTATEWNDGTFTNTTVSGDALVLDGSNTAGTFVSETFDAGDEYDWNSLDVESTLNGGSATVSVATSNNDFAAVQDRSTFTLSGGVETFDLSGLNASRYIRFNYTLVNGSSSPRVGGTNVTLGGQLHFIIRDTACQDDERELFSMSNDSNAHAANPGFYNDYSVCASGINRSRIETVCTDVETPVISFFEPNATFSHISTEDELFDYKLCTGQLSVGLRDTCPASTKAIVSVFELPESHVARPGAYPHQLCGAVFTEVSLLLEFHLGGNDDVYINETANPPQGTYRNPDGWDSASITAENASMVAGIVSGENTRTTAIGYGESGNDHVFNVTQKRGTVSYFVPFTEGDFLTIRNRVPLIEQGAFLDEITPSFAYELVESATIQLTLELVGADLVTDMVLARGVHRLIIQNLGPNAEGQPQVSVNVTAR